MAISKQLMPSIRELSRDYWKYLDDIAGRYGDSTKSVIERGLALTYDKWKLTDVRYSKAKNAKKEKVDAELHEFRSKVLQEQSLNSRLKGVAISELLLLLKQVKADKQQLEEEMEEVMNIELQEESGFGRWA